MKKKFLAVTLCLLMLLLTACNTSTGDIYDENKKLINELNTDWDKSDAKYYGIDDYTYSPSKELTIKTVQQHNVVSESEFSLGENTFRTLIPTKLLESDMSSFEYHDYASNGTYDFLIADNDAQLLYWLGFVPNSLNGITQKTIDTFRSSQPDDFAIPAGYEANEDYEKFFIENDEYFGIVFECDNRGVSESDEINADSMHGYYVQLYDKTTYDYIAQFIGGSDCPDDLLEIIRLSGWCLRVKH